MKKVITLFLVFLMFPFSSLAISNDDLVNLTSNAKSSVMIESTTGKVLYNYNANKVLSVASLTKMMSLILVFEFIEQGGMSYDEIVTISKNAQDMGGTQLWLAEGDKISVSDLLKGIVMASANDAMYAIAERVAGTEEAFVNLMNKKVKELGLKNTSFANCIGFDDANNYSTAYDMALIAKELITHEDIFSFSGIYEDYIRKGTENESWIANTNKLVRFYDGADGLKTGWTTDAGSCICATAMKNDLRLIVVSLGYSDNTLRNNETINLLNYGFNQYKVDVIYKKGEIIDTKSLKKASQDNINLVVEDDVLILQKKVDEKCEYKEEIKLDNITYPIKKGDKLGTLYIKDSNGIIAKSTIISDSNINKKSFISLFFTNLKNILTGN